MVDLLGRRIGLSLDQSPAPCSLASPGQRLQASVDVVYQARFLLIFHVIVLNTNATLS